MKKLLLLSSMLLCSIPAMHAAAEHPVGDHNAIWREPLLQSIREHQLSEEQARLCLQQAHDRFNNLLGDVTIEEATAYFNQFLQAQANAGKAEALVPANAAVPAKLPLIEIYRLMKKDLDTLNLGQANKFNTALRAQAGEAGMIDIERAYAIFNHIKTPAIANAAAQQQAAAQEEEKEDVAILDVPAPAVVEDEDDMALDNPDREDYVAPGLEDQNPDAQAQEEEDFFDDCFYDNKETISYCMQHCPQVHQLNAEYHEAFRRAAVQELSNGDQKTLIKRDRFEAFTIEYIAKNQNQLQANAPELAPYEADPELAAAIELSLIQAGEAPDVDRAQAVRPGPGAALNIPGNLVLVEEIVPAPLDPYLAPGDADAEQLAAAIALSLIQADAAPQLNNNKQSTSPLTMSVLALAAVTGIYAAYRYLPKIKTSVKSFLKSFFINKKEEVIKKPITTQANKKRR